MTSTIKVDTISENTSANGVAIDSVTLKDGGITATAASTITTADNTDTLTLTSTDADANVGPNLRLYRNSGSPANSDVLGAIEFEGRNNNSQDVVYGSIVSSLSDVTDGAEHGLMEFKSMVGGTNQLRMSFDDTSVIFNQDSIDSDFRVESNGNTHMLFIEGGTDRILINKSSATTKWFNGTSIVPNFEIFGTDNTSGRMTALTYGADDAGAAMFVFGKQRDGTPDSYTIAQNNDQLGIISFQGADGTHFVEAASIRVDVDKATGSDDMPGRIEFHTTADGANAGSERMRIGSGGHIGIGVATESNKVRILQDQSDENCVQIEYDTSSADESVMRWFCDRSANAAWDFLQAYSNNASSADLEYQMRSAGDMSMDGTLTENGADYAEYFETVDGNAIAIGKTVVLENGKVRASTSSDDASAIIGVVRPKENGKISAVIGNAGWNKWHNKYLTDDFGVYIWEDYTVKEWT